jgi:DNA-binding MarR family transcriptional regulator
MPTTTKADPAALLDSPSHLLHRASQCAGDVFGNEMDRSKFDVTPRQLAVLIAIEANPNGSQTTLVEATGVDRSTLADIMRRIVKKGWAQRRRTKADARAYSVNLTASGKQVLERGAPALSTIDKRMLEPLSATDRKAFIKSLITIVDSMSRNGMKDAE